MNYNYPETGINTIYLMLGFACNFSCRHCIQEATDTSNVTPQNNISSGVIEYIEHLVNIRPTYYPKLKIMFWGGEPLIYIDIIKNVVNRLKDKVSYSLVTNGGLFTADIVEFINANDIHVALSYDGPKTASVRNINILEDKSKLELFKGIKNKSICSVISAYNYDFSKLYTDVADKVGTDISIYLEPLRITWDMPADLYSINPVEYQKCLHKQAIIAVEDLLQGVNSYSVQFFMPYLQTYNTTSYIPMKCMQTYRVLNIDLQGNVYPCHNTCVQIGTINDSRDKLIKSQEDFINKTMLEECNKCSAYNICRGGCPNEIKANSSRVSCMYTRIVATEIDLIIHKIETNFLEVDLEV